MKGERRNADCADLIGVYAQQTQKIQIGIRSTGARSPTVTATSRAIGRIASGGTVLDPEVVAQLIGRRHDPLELLTPREREVLTLMAEGRTNAAIAAALVIGTGAVEKNVTSIFQKLGLDDSGSDHRRVLAVLTWLQR